MNLGMIVRCDNTGLGNQTRELVKMLNPRKVLIIDSTSFNKNKQNLEWYEGYDQAVTRFGFPKRGEIISFLKDLDVVLSCETFYSSMFVDIARDIGVKTVLQYNYEFLVNIERKDESLPDVLLAPSLWKFEEMQSMFGDQARLIHLPPPTDIKLFNNARSENLSRTHNRILHVAGKKAARDRNGTDTVLEMLRYSKEDYTLVITSQTELEGRPRDPRVSFRHQNLKNREDLYAGYDAMILPRRYAGLCLPMNEALISGLPVFMTDLSPNNQVLPKQWLVDAQKTGEFRAKSIIDVYSGDPKQLARLVDNYIGMRKKNQMQIKQQALDIGVESFSPEILKDKYLELFDSLK